jgi:diguanylate cyclase (GGDEF)-like protein
MVNAAAVGRLLAVPLGLFAAAALAGLFMNTLPPSAGEVAPYAAWAALAGGMPLAERFRRSRAVFVLLLGCGVFLLLYNVLPALGDATRVRLWYGIVLTLLPCNLLLFAFLEDRGVFSRWGMGMLAWLLGQFMTAAFIVRGGGVLLATSLGRTMQRAVEGWVYASPLPGWFDSWTPLTQPALLLVLLAAVVLVVRVVRLEDGFSASLLGTLLSLTAAFHSVGNGPVVSLFVAAAGAAQLTALFRDSYSMAFVDELTEVPSRRALMADAKKLGGSYCVAMADVDHFKAFNDTYGHDVGDDVLRMVAARLAGVDGGKVYRYGGEEFTILFPRLGKAEARPHLESVREAVAAIPFRIRTRNKSAKVVRDKSVTVTVSIGLAQREDGEDDFESVLKKADKALYKAKKAGRNKVALL